MSYQELYNADINFAQIKKNGHPYCCPFNKNFIFESWQNWKRHWYGYHHEQYFHVKSANIAGNSNDNQGTNNDRVTQVMQQVQVQQEQQMQQIRMQQMRMQQMQQAQQMQQIQQIQEIQEQQQSGSKNDNINNNNSKIELSINTFEDLGKERSVLSAMITQFENEMIDCTREMKKEHDSVKTQISQMDTCLEESNDRIEQLMVELKAEQEKCDQIRMTKHHLVSKIEDEEKNMERKEKEFEYKVNEINKQLDTKYKKLIENWQEWDVNTGKAFLKHAIRVVFKLDSSNKDKNKNENENENTNENKNKNKNDNEDIKSSDENMYIENVDKSFNLNGKELRKLNESSLKLIGIGNKEDRKKLLHFIKNVIVFNSDDSDRSDDDSDIDVHDLNGNKNKNKGKDNKSKIIGYTCLICVTNPVVMMYNQCGHLCLCQECYQDWNKEKQYCPQCHQVSPARKLFASGY